MSMLLRRHKKVAKVADKKVTEVEPVEIIEPKEEVIEEVVEQVEIVEEKEVVQEPEKTVKKKPKDK